LAELERKYWKCGKCGEEENKIETMEKHQRSGSED
jgi:hypothetical protein